MQKRQFQGVIADAGKQAIAQLYPDYRYYTSFKEQGKWWASFIGRRDTSLTMHAPVTIDLQKKIGEIQFEGRKPWKFRYNVRTLTAEPRR